jgi:hypothetical protein
MAVSFIKATALCVKCKEAFVDPDDVERFHGRVSVLYLDDAKRLTHGIRGDGTPCGGRIEMMARPKRRRP